MQARLLDTKRRESWVRQEGGRALKADASEAPLIDLDYVQIITRADNWRGVFQPCFGRLEDIRESMQRLFPARIAVMHVRIMTLDDELFFLAETTRILRRIEKTP